MSYFSGCASVEEAKKLYHALLKKNHPDIAGDAGQAETVEIIKEFKEFLDNFAKNSFRSYYTAKGEEADFENLTPLMQLLHTVAFMDCEVEVIGKWIYCFNSYSVRGRLKELGFWFSSKHKAWIFSGSVKKQYVTGAKLDQIRAAKGCVKVRKAQKKEEAKPKHKSYSIR